MYVPPAPTRPAGAFAPPRARQATAESSGPPDPPPLPLPARVAFVAVCLGYVMTILDAPIVNVALPPIGAELDAVVSGLRWVMNGSTLAVAARLLADGALGDRLWATRVFLGGLAVFSAA